ncbi:MAG: hypothetical protein J7L72_03325 [Candidatus Aminicenantes bacterium]|nr:hypothetical protein [Candidatus Aminicenantes bacterium]
MKQILERTFGVEPMAWARPINDDEKSLISALKDANAEKDRILNELWTELTEAKQEIRRLWRYVEFLKLRGGQ